MALSNFLDLYKAERSDQFRAGYFELITMKDDIQQRIKVPPHVTTVLQLAEMLAPFYKIQPDLLFFKDPDGNYLVAEMNLRKTLFSPIQQTLKNFVPTVIIVHK